ncbi:MAG: hypothetical protein HC845_14780 [Akkermansiaceae bacterium]|nr:hypothetical protein [Akkermansiaceae bacterium]
MLEMESVEADDQFWDAIELTNQQLETTGLYITHLFIEDQIILSPNWLNTLVPIELPNLKQLRLFRPSTLGLMLTKMMRIDPQDRSDLAYLFSQLGKELPLLQAHMEQAVIPDIAEIREAFQNNRQWIGKNLLRI